MANQIWFITWNGNKSTCYHYVYKDEFDCWCFFRPLYLLFDVHERKFANYTTPKTTTLLGKPRILWKGSFSVAKKRGVISRFIKSLPFVCKLLLIYQCNIYHLPIFISSYLHIVPHWDKNPGIFSNLFATSWSIFVPYHHQQPYEISSGQPKPGSPNVFDFIKRLRPYIIKPKALERWRWDPEETVPNPTQNGSGNDSWILRGWGGGMKFEKKKKTGVKRSRICRSLDFWETFT